jgi:hypothetical protein
MKAIILVIRIIGLIVTYFICFTFISAVLLPPTTDQQTLARPGVTLAALLVLSLLNSIVLTFIILRSRYAGWPLVLAIFFIFYGVMTVLPQIETAYFVKLPPGMLPRLFLFGAVFASLFSALAVLILGKRRIKGGSDEGFAQLNMLAHEWLFKLGVIVVAYLVLYFTFGYFIAWKSEAVRAYYGGSDPGSLLTQMSNVLCNTPLLIPLQVGRAILWTAIAAVVIRIMKGHWWEAGLAVALLFAVMSTQLLLPNPFMPFEVRMVHLVETASSNFVFGWLVVIVLCGWKLSGARPKTDVVSMRAFDS